MKYFTALVAIAAAQEQIEVSEHDNYVEFQGADIEYEFKDYDISSGQPFDGVTSKNDTMDIKAGRHGSGGPAATFMAGVSVQNVMGLGVELDMTPAALNFVVLGDMKFTFKDGSEFTCPDFRVA